MTFDHLRVLRALVEHEVRFVLIGGLAGRVHGSPSVTFDTDICYERSTENLELLVAVLRELGATLRGVDEGVPFLLDARTLRNGDNFTFETSAGPFDILGHPSGTAGYEDLVKGAVATDLGDDLAVLVVALEDLIRMKQAASRVKDRIELEYLYALRERITRRDA